MAIVDRSWPSTGRPPSDEQLLGFVVNLVGRLMSKEFNRRLAGTGVSVGQWRVMLVLSGCADATQAELVRELTVEQPTMANTLKRLERDGLIERSASPTDRRSERIRLTPRGAELVPRIAPIADEANKDALEGLTRDEVRTLVSLLSRVADNLR
ncbi:MarR family transcriptional regulator [Actinomyces viscosus]|uniref:MarR family winged helix-turn-helix transcriptional regulator n=1 Tax=Actinomyces viscosus TaxID=1656 RepID=UPI0028ED113F|nr:MarR family transcriptional regulator [Actinomyces viscosus]